MKYHVLEHHDRATNLLELHVLHVGVTQADASQDPDAMVLDLISLRANLSDDAQNRIRIVRHGSHVQQTRYGYQGTLEEGDAGFVAYGATEQEAVQNLLTELDRMVTEGEL